MSKFSAKRYHDISCGHRVTGHESKCRHLHGHNYRVHFTCVALKEGILDLLDPDLNLGSAIHANGVDSLGRVIDFSVIKERLCMWIENNWDHKFLAWENDSIMESIYTALMNHIPPSDTIVESCDIISESIVWTPFNPTAENMAQYLVEVVGPLQLEGTGVVLTEVLVEETSKCHASYSL